MTTEPAIRHTRVVATVAVLVVIAAIGVAFGSTLVGGPSAERGVAPPPATMRLSHVVRM